MSDLGLNVFCGVWSWTEVCFAVSDLGLKCVLHCLILNWSVFRCDRSWSETCFAESCLGSVFCDSDLGVNCVLWRLILDWSVFSRHLFLDWSVLCGSDLGLKYSLRCLILDWNVFCSVWPWTEVCFAASDLDWSVFCCVWSWLKCVLLCLILDWCEFCCVWSGTVVCFAAPYLGLKCAHWLKWCVWKHHELKVLQETLHFQGRQPCQNCFCLPSVKGFTLHGTNCAATWEMYLRTCVFNEGSNQSANPLSLIRVFVVRMKKLCILCNPKHAQSILAGRTCPKVCFLTLRLICCCWEQNLSLYQKGDSISDKMWKQNVY